MTAEPEGSPSATLDALRRSRGEGWDWPRIQTDPCPQCGDHPGVRPLETLGELARRRAEAWGQFLADSNDVYLRTNPRPGVFSPLQYGAHVRDILRVYTDRMLLGLREDKPSFASFNPDDDTWESYNRLDPDQLGHDIDAQAQRLQEVLNGVRASGWGRTVVSNRGGDGVYTFTVAGLACNAVHEAHHHLLDANGTLPIGSDR